MMKISKKICLTLFAFTLGLIVVGSASAEIIYFNDFESNTADFGNSNGGAALTLKTADSNFSSGYLEIAGNTDGNFSFPNFNNSDDSEASAVTTFSFDGRFNTADFGTFSRFRIRARPTSFNAGNNDITRVDIGRQAEAPALDVVNRYDYAINNSATDETIAGLGGTLSAGTWAIYENGVELDSGDVRTVGQGNPVGTGIDFLTLWVQGDEDNDIQAFARIDNFTVRNEAFVFTAVPEPGSLLLFGTLGLTGLVRRRKA
jgi:hypothetical protein